VAGQGGIAQTDRKDEEATESWPERIIRLDWEIPLLVPPPSDSTVAFPVLTMQILAYNQDVSTEKRGKMRIDARA
jgi:hypothetical protein